MSCRPAPDGCSDLVEQHVAGEAAERGIVRERVRFTRRELRERLGWGDTQLKVHLARLVSLELVWVHRGPHGASLYELAWDGDSRGRRAAPRGLIDPDQLDPEHVYDADRSGPGSDRSGAGRPPVGARSAAGRGDLQAVAVEMRKTGRTPRAIPGDPADSQGFPVLVASSVSRWRFAATRRGHWRTSGSRSATSPPGSPIAGSRGPGR